MGLQKRVRREEGGNYRGIKWEFLKDLSSRMFSISSFVPRTFSCAGFSLPFPFINETPLSNRTEFAS